MSDQRPSNFWRELTDVDAWLDQYVAAAYQAQPLAQDWARVAKIAEELGEALAELILLTGQNPRKGADPDALDRLLNEAADVACTALLGIQHFTKDSVKTASVLNGRMTRIWNRMSGD